MATFEEVVEAVERGRVDLGMLPLENNEAGETGARELIGAADVRIVREVVLPVQMHLLGTQKARLDDIETVVSHPVAIRQCSKYLAKLGVETRPTTNTAVAARTLTNKNVGVLASAAAARIYGLIVLQSNVHDRPDNATRFAILARRSED